MRVHEILSRTLLVYLFAFILNLIWEELHHVLYVHYRGGEITHFILLYASIIDALIITIISLPFIIFEKIRSFSFLIVVIGIIFAISLEGFALETGRWAYTEAMPILPFFNTGLTPSIQLGILGYISYFLASYGYKMTRI